MEPAPSRSKSALRFRPIVLSGLISFLVVLSVLLYLGPVWIYDVEDHVIAFIFGPIFLLFCLALLSGADSFAADSLGLIADSVSTAVEAVGFLSRLVGRFLRGAAPAAVGLFVGSILAFGLVWALSKTEPLRLVYARARPTRALSSDYLEVIPVLRDYKKQHGRPPPDPHALARAIDAAGTALKYSTIREGIWRDPWDQPFHYEASHKPLLGWRIDLYSVGRNGIDEKGKGDDISLQTTLYLWSKASEIIRSLLSTLE